MESVYVAEYILGTGLGGWVGGVGGVGGGWGGGAFYTKKIPMSSSDGKRKMKKGGSQ